MDASFVTMNTENIKGPLLLSSSGQYIFQFLFQNTLAAILLKRAKEGEGLFLHHYQQLRENPLLLHRAGSIWLQRASQTGTFSHLMSSVIIHTVPVLKFNRKHETLQWVPFRPVSMRQPCFFRLLSALLWWTGRFCRFISIKQCCSIWLC